MDELALFGEDNDFVLRGELFFKEVVVLLLDDDEVWLGFVDGGGEERRTEHSGFEELVDVDLREESIFDEKVEVGRGRGG